MLHINDIDREVAGILNHTGLGNVPRLAYSVTHTHYDIDSKMDKFIITFTNSRGRSETFEYGTWTGRRVTRGKGNRFGPIAAGKNKATLKELRLLTGQKKVTWEEQGNNNSHNPSYLVIAPTQASVLYGLLSDMDCADCTFNDFCDSLGYDNDSMSAHKTYLACQESGEKLRRVIDNKTIEQLQELLQDY